MFRPRRTWPLLIAISAAGSAAPAQPTPAVAGGGPSVTPRGASIPFRPVAGVREFSGSLIARPKQPSDYAALPASEAAFRDQEARSRLAAFAPTYVPEVDEYVFNLPTGYTEDSLAAALLESGLYQWVTPNWMLFPTQAHEIIPDDPGYPGQWHLPRISAPAAWDISPGSPTVIVAVIDTGVDFTHPDLSPNMVLGYCSWCSPTRAQTATPPWNTITMDSLGHGTAVAGVLGAVGNNGLGISGVAWNLRIMPIRVTSASGTGGSFGTIQNGALWATAQGAKVVTVSFTGIEEPLFDTLGQSIRSRNALLVWSMDNRGANADDFIPAGEPKTDHPNITVVSGSGLNDEHWCPDLAGGRCSSYGTLVDIAAPAYGIAVTTIGGGYSVNEGVSFAAPQVAAALGMIWSIAPSMLATEVEQVLLASADDIGAPGEDLYFGRGRLNVRRAMWNAVIRQNATSLPPAPYNTRAFSIDDVYDFVTAPMDVTGDGVIDHKEMPAVQAFMRRNESKDLVGNRP